MNRYHRNSALAFPKTADYGCAIERPRHESRWSVILGCTLMGIVYAALVVYGWST